MNTAAELPVVSPEPGVIKFEQPLSERMRTFLRIEFLHEQARFHANEPTDFGTRAAVTGLLEILTILGRGDVRSDVLKELERHAEMLGKYKSKPGVDTARLKRLIDNIEALRGRIADAGSQLINPLKECEFLNTIRHRSGMPGGACAFDLPDYGYWLHLPAAERRRQLETWIGKIEPLCDAAAEVLWLTREATVPTDEVATGGFFQHNVDRTEQMSLIRVLLPANAGIYPEVSAGPRRFTLRFLRWRGVDERPVQVNQDVRFQLAIC